MACFTGHETNFLSSHNTIICTKRDIPFSSKHHLNKIPHQLAVIG